MFLGEKTGFTEGLEVKAARCVETEGVEKFFIQWKRVFSVHGGKSWKGSQRKEDKLLEEREDPWTR